MLIFLLFYRNYHPGSVELYAFYFVCRILRNCNLTGPIPEYIYMDIGKVEEIVS